MEESRSILPGVFTKTAVLIFFVTMLLLLPDESNARGGSGRRSSSGYRTYKGAKAIDGDTFRHQGQRYRLRDYNAPEIGQPGANKATQNLQKKLDSGSRYETVAKDAYGRSLVQERSAE